MTTAKGLVDVNLVMTASKQFAEKHPEALETVVRVEREADEWIKANWQEAVAIGAKEHGISLADAESCFRSLWASKPGQRSSSAPSRRSGPHSGGVRAFFLIVQEDFPDVPPSRRSALLHASW